MQQHNFCNRHHHRYLQAQAVLEPGQYAAAAPKSAQARVQQVAAARDPVAVEPEKVVELPRAEGQK